MNTYKHKPMPHGVKVRKLFNRQFILGRERYNQLIEMCESYEIKSISQAVAFIDYHGEWLDG